ncbi:MAG: fimbrial biogenesis outer membrane usher protein [Geminicoccaceae bacterium]|nr:fimbrial biogenesis outer membrane usher protein [Geminicoccaceae bacterium]
MLEEDRWREWLLAPVINGEARAEAAFLVQDPVTGRLAVELETARRWRLVIDPDAVLSFQGQPFLPLDAVDGATWSIDPVELTLTLDAPGAAFQAYALELGERERPIPRTGFGGFLDYDLLATVGEGVDRRLDGLAEAGVFGEFGTLVSSVQLEDVTRDSDLVRLDTTFARDFPDQRATLRVGDGLTTGGAFARAVRFGGLHYGTNFATDPNFVTFPLPAIGGLADQRSVVEVIVDNITRSTSDVPAGPFSIANLPVVTGAGEVQLKITDLLGRERIVTQGYYVSPRLLREGLHEFGYEAGFEREDFGSESFDYGDPIATATHRYGLSEAATLEVHAEAAPERIGAVAGGALRVGRFGVVTGGLGGSLHDDAGSGGFGQATLESTLGPLNLSLRTRYAGADFRQHGDGPNTPRRVDEARLGVDLGRAGRLGLFALNQSRRERRDSRAVSASYTVPLGPGSLIVNAAHTLTPDAETALTASYTLPLGAQRNLTAQVSGDEDDRQVRAIYRRSRGASDLGLDYRLAAETGSARKRVDLRMDYQTSHAGLRLDAEAVDGDTAGRLGVDGSIALVDGEVAVSRRIGRAFGIVDLAGLEGVPVFLDNRRAGTTDAEGRLVLPDLRPYQSNRVRVDMENLPLDAHGDGEAVAVPFDRAGLKLDLGIRRYRGMTARLVDASGTPLPGGLFLEDGRGAITALVGKDGLAEVQGFELSDRAIVTLEGVAAGEDELAPPVTFRCPVRPPAAGDDPMPFVGDVTCGS